MSSYYSSPPSSYLSKMSPFQEEACRCTNLGKLSALVNATIFSGAAIYINLVEQPARLTLDNPGALKQWKESYNRAMPIQAGLGVITAVQGAALAYMTGEKIWLIGAGLMLTNMPYTLLFIMPLNKKMLATSETMADGITRADLNRWNNLHAVRTVLGFSAVAIFAYAIYKKL